jgi:hypothetical protein
MDRVETECTGHRMARERLGRVDLMHGVNSEKAWYRFELAAPDSETRADGPGSQADGVGPRVLTF